MLRKLTVIAIALLALVALASAPASAQYGTDSGVEGVGVDTGSGSGSGSGADDGTLARTGWDVNVPVVVGASLIVAGGLVLTLRRRRTPTLV